jgi:ADP-ribosyl-[dinitrogen reductase] hydrolase
MEEFMENTKGHCFCQEVEFEIEGELDFLSHCHCHSCRKSHGAAFVTWTSVDRNHFNYLKGEDLLSSYESSAGTKWFFCKKCGTNLLYTSLRKPEKIYITAANLEEISRRADAHVNFQEHVDWYFPQDSLPKLQTIDETRYKCDDSGYLWRRYVITLQSKTGHSTDFKLIKEHVDFLRALDQEGKLEFAGPFSDKKGGLIIIKAKTHFEAMSIANSDPFVKSGSRLMKLREIEKSCEDNLHLGVLATQK